MHQWVLEHGSDLRVNLPSGHISKPRILRHLCYGDSQCCAMKCFFMARDELFWCAIKALYQFELSYRPIFYRPDHLVMFLHGTANIKKHRGLIHAAKQRTTLRVR